MAPERWQRIKELFHAALPLGEAERRDFLARECREDRELRGEVESLLSRQVGAVDEAMTEDAAADERPAAGGVMARCPQCRSVVEPGQVSLSGALLCQVCGASVGAGEAMLTRDEMPLHKQVGRFELVERIGRGAFGEVYKARDPLLGRLVAVKIPRLATLLNEAEFERFQREARSMAQLRHGGIVPVHEVGFEEGVPFLVSELVEGVTLAERLSAAGHGGGPAGALPARLSAELVEALAEALQYAHEQGVIHRDIKPSNIMLDREGRPRLMDFGVAKRDGGDATMTTDGALLGTPAYMSPEQARGEAHLVDGRSDVYSLGVILYQLLAGELPFRGNSRMVLHQVLHDPPRAPRSLNDKIPRNLETICLKAMAKEPDRRFRSARELAEDLRRFLDGRPVQARPVNVVARVWLWCQRAERLQDAGAIAVFLGVICIVWMLFDMMYFGVFGRALRPPEALWQRAVLVVLYFVPIVFVGLYTLKRRATAVVMGVVYGALGAVGAVIFRYPSLVGQELEFGGTYKDPEQRVSLAALFLILSQILMVVYLIAALAYRANRHSMRWYRAVDSITATTSAAPPHGTSPPPVT